MARSDGDMTEEGKYIYCIIETNCERNFGPMGIGGRGDEVATIGYQDLTAVISNTPMTKYAVSRENMMAHQKVIETVMKDYTVLPVRFCTIAANAEEVRSLLRKRYGEFKNLLKDMDNKVELGVKALWKDMDATFREIATESEAIKGLKEKLTTKSPEESYADRIKIGEMVKSALELKKERIAEELMDALKKSSIHFRVNNTYGDRMILNAAFLVDRGREKEFDNRINELQAQYGEKIKFKYVGPVPPYNFVNIVLYLNE